MYSFVTFAGGETGNGGDSIAIEFSSIAYTTLAMIQSNNNLFPEFKAVDLRQAIFQTELVTIDRLYLNGVEKDAINYPLGKKIEISRIRWNECGNDYVRKSSLVFHEYLGIMGVDDSGYNISERLFSSISVLKLELGGNYGSTLQECGIRIVAKYFNNVYVELIDNPLSGFLCNLSKEVMNLNCMGNVCSTIDVLMDQQTYHENKIMKFYHYYLSTDQMLGHLLFGKNILACKDLHGNIINCPTEEVGQNLTYINSN